MIIFTLCLILGAILAIPVSGFAVYGRFINKKDLDTYLTNNLMYYELNTMGHGILSGIMDRPFIARPNNLLFKWYINGTGTIPRWSKWTKILDKKYAQLLPDTQKKEKSINRFIRKTIKQ